MELIQTIRLSRLSNGAYIDLHVRAYELLDEAAFTHPALETLKESYGERLDAIKRVMERRPGSPLTPEVAAAAESRVSTLRTLFMMVKIAADSPDPAVCEAGERLSALMHGYRKALRSRYAEQTGQIRALLELLSRGEAPAWVETIEAEALVSRLEADNEAFFEEYGRRLEERANRPARGISTPDQRRLIDADFRGIVGVVNSMVVAQATGINTGFDPVRLADFVLKMNALLTQYRWVIAHGPRRHPRGLDRQMQARLEAIAAAEAEIVRLRAEYDALAARKEIAEASEAPKRRRKHRG